ncbi:MAG: hypothetical protein ACD_79C00130G0005 [uncultured bacterium]|nr:MAG: hypothetical protein ACD_79C00130G0005 [uncultured bacterium]
MLEVMFNVPSDEGVSECHISKECIESGVDPVIVRSKQKKKIA